MRATESPTRCVVSIPLAESLLLLVSVRVYDADLTDLLTLAERRVAALAAEWIPNRRIAELRGCSPRTVANQLASVYRKLALSGRRELRARLSGGTRTAPVTRETILGALAGARLSAACLTAAGSEWQEVLADEEVWRRVVHGHWSIVGYTECGSRESYLVRHNPPDVAHLRKLSPRELDVTRMSLLGQSNKAIAYTLGLSTSSVAEYLGRAQRKLGGEEAIIALGRLQVVVRTNASNNTTHESSIVISPPPLQRRSAGAG